MRKFITLLAAAIFAIGPMPYADAGGICGVRTISRQKTIVAANQVAAVKFVTPFALAHGVPVAPYNGVQYSYNNSNFGYGQQAPATSQADQLRQIIREELAAAGVIEAETATPPAASLVAEHCVKCHGATTAEKGLRLDMPLTDAQRLLSAKRVLLGEMPPQGAAEMDPQVRGDLIGELVGAEAGQ